MFTENSSYFEMIKCIHIVLDKILVNDCLPQVILIFKKKINFTFVLNMIKKGVCNYEIDIYVYIRLIIQIRQGLRRLLPIHIRRK